MNVSLSSHFERFIEEKVESGDYASPSEVIRAGLDRLAYEQQMRDQVQAMIDEALADVNSGNYIDVADNTAYFENIWNEVIEKRRRSLNLDTDRVAS